MSRVILHADLNNFFASVEAVLDPSLAGKALAVCGAPELRHGIVLAKSEPAKKLGVKTGMAIWQARQLCPDIIILTPHHKKYEVFSKRVREIYYRYTDLVESFGIDECWLDVTASLKLFQKNGEELANEIREVVKRETGLTVSVGVSWNKVFAKLGSDIKKPDAVTVIDEGNYREVAWRLPASDLLYVGKKTAAALELMNILTIGDLAAANENLLAARFGKNAMRMVSMARGLDAEPVRPFDYKREVKSVGNGTTLERDLQSEREVSQVLLILCEEVAFRMRKKGVRGTTVSVSVRGGDLQWTGAQMSFAQSTNAAVTIHSWAMKVFTKIWAQDSGVQDHHLRKSAFPAVRSIRVSVSGLTPDVVKGQISMFDSENEQKNDKISEVFDQIRRKHGTKSIMFGAAFDGLGQLKFDVLDE